MCYAGHRHWHVYGPRATRLPENRYFARQGRGCTRRYLAPPWSALGRFHGTESVVPAVFAAADNAIASLLTVPAITPGSPFENHLPNHLAFDSGHVFARADGPAGGGPFADLLQRANLRLVTGSGRSEATFGNPKPKYSTHSFVCHFAEVTWQPEIARLHVSRALAVMDARRIINPLAGRNQIRSE